MKKYLFLLLCSFILLEFISCKEDPIIIKEPNPFEKTCNQTILDVPENKTIDDCSNNENLYIAIGKTVNSKYYQVKTKGNITGKVLFINYNQSLESVRIFNENTIFTNAISKSALKNVAIQRYVNHNKYYYREGKVHDDRVDWNEFEQISEEKFLEQFGQKPWGVSSYIINDETITSSNKEYIDGKYVFTFTLDTQKSTQYYAQEIKYSSGAGDFPEFLSIKINVTMDNNWNIDYIEYEEQYDLDILGGVICTSKIKETYEFYDEFIEVKEIEKIIEK